MKAVGLIGLALLLARTGQAQIGVPLPDSLEWERLALSPDIYFRREADGIGFCADSMYVIRSGLYIIRGGGPGHPASEGEWIEVNRSGGFDITCLSTTQHAAMYWSQAAAISRSYDGGYTREVVLSQGQKLPVQTQFDEIIARFDSPDYGTCRTRNGDDWTCIQSPLTEVAYNFAPARPGGPIAPNVLMSNGIGGPAYSLDGGETWQPSDLAAAWGPFGPGLAVIDGGPLHGTAVAVVKLTTAGYRVYHSTDGMTWTDVGPTPSVLGPGRESIRLLAVPGGLLAAYYGFQQIYLSGDGGRSWELTFDSDGPLSSGDQVADVEVGPDGYLYAAVISQQTQDADERGGVYRTAVPVAMPVASEPAPGAPPLPVSIAVRPNPAAGRAAAVVRLAEAGTVLVDVLDRGGRHVATVHDGPAAAGETVFSIDTSAWAAGLYFVRATGLGRLATAALTVAH